jgi:uncharacterized OB-fold protein
MTMSAVKPGLFTEAVQAGDEVHLRSSRCDACGRVEFPATPACVNCGGSTIPEDLPVEAVLVGFSSVQYAPPGALVPVPYHVGVARFGDDLCVMGLLDGADPTGSDLDFGRTLRTVAVAVDGDTLTYGFRPSS